MNTRKRIVVIGATSAIAHQCSRLWAQEGGCDFLLVSRDAGRSEPLAADLRARGVDNTAGTVAMGFDDADAIAALARDAANGGPIDIVLIAHGSLPRQQDCQDDLCATKDALVTNGLSPALFAEAFIGVMQGADRGHLCLIGSVAGDRGRKSNYVYGAAKGAGGAVRPRPAASPGGHPHQGDVGQTRPHGHADDGPSQAGRREAGQRRGSRAGDRQGHRGRAPRGLCAGQMGLDHADHPRPAASRASQAQHIGLAAPMRTTLLYALFCIVAIAVNIGTQDVVVWLWPSGILLSIVAGTATGLVIKYILDKRFIFCFTPQSAVHNGKTFVLYTSMGVATTAIFWGFEYGFWLAFGTARMRYLGGVIGLVIGYVTKYHLDKHFVFKAGIAVPRTKLRRNSPP
ncbi:GtrA family protein [Ottowia sp.]|uniref:GtrA family protein n=1 Tax=Ottowia sp. TaxID=1898956 RepID=UPI0025CE4AFD|nr:GtrA family protein [Ottowia sp.]